jgi:streptogramin lyase
VATKKKKKVLSSGHGARKVQASKMLAIGATQPKRRSQRWAVVLGLLVAVALLVQGVLVFIGNKKKDVIPRFEAQLAQRGAGLGEVSGCRTLAVDEKGDVAYVFATGADCVLQVFSADGKKSVRYQAKRKEEALNNVFSVAFAVDGSLWACERGSGRIVHLSPDLKFLGSFTAPSTDLPGIAVDPAGLIWVASYGPKIYVYNAQGKLQKEFTGTPRVPIVSAYRMTFDPQGDLLLLDSGRGQGKDPDIKIYSPEGKSIGVFMAKGLPFNEFSCIGVDQGLVVLNDNGSNGNDTQGILFFDYKGRCTQRAITTSNQLSLGNVPGLAISRKGHWALDMTPVGRGCDRFSLPNPGE